MYFNKIDIPDNFKFNDQELKPSLTNLGNDVFHFSIDSKRWKDTGSQAEFSRDLFKDKENKFSVSYTSKGLVVSKGKSVILSSLPTKDVGVSGTKWLLNFNYEKKLKFYGQGEKNNGFEKSETFTKFWNTDIWGDFATSEIIDGVTDPMYVSIPYILIKNGNNWLGLLLDNPYPVFMALGPVLRIANQQEAKNAKEFYIGSTNGKPSVYILVGDSAASVTQKLQKLVGTTPRPPLWSLGHQQCKWGYKSYKDLDSIEKNFKKHMIPNDGLWLDIDYMERFKVFTYNKKYFKNPQKQIKELASRNKHVVPIIDPGVKKEKDYFVYEEGLKKNYFCQTTEGEPYVGYVWPGRTLFPDFSLKEVRSWWADKVCDFAKSGISGAWLDMNDPSVGRAELDEMKFDYGKKNHEYYHNQYAFGMGKASHEGFLKANPNKRPFLLSRSASTSSGRYTAVWTGDNYSNFHHLKNAIPITLNLSLSGIPFNGPDVPGFAGDTNDELAIKWYKAGFLFPFLRNHAVHTNRPQEPWAFNDKTNSILTTYIRLRYKLLPYLYNTYINQELYGDPILRPLFYHFKSKKGLELEKIDDQFMVGSDIMQAPILNEGTNTRDVLLPMGNWFSSHDGKFIKGGKYIKTVTQDKTTPLYFKEGAIISMQEGVRTDNFNDLANIELHLFLSKSSRGKYKSQYIFDDGSSFDYKKGKESLYDIFVQNIKGTLDISIKEIKENAGHVTFSVILYDDFKHVVINGQKIKTKSIKSSFPGIKKSWKALMK